MIFCQAHGGGIQRKKLNKLRYMDAVEMVLGTPALSGSRKYSLAKLFPPFVVSSAFNSAFKASWASCFAVSVDPHVLLPGQNETSEVRY